MFGMGMQEVIIIGVIAVLLFGRRLPEVAKTLGGSYREFRKGLSDLQSQVNVNEIMNSSSSSYRSSAKSPSYTESSYGDIEDRDEATAPRFEPPPAEPQESTLSESNTTPATPPSAPTADLPSDKVSRMISEN